MHFYFYCGHYSLHSGSRTLLRWYTWRFNSQIDSFSGTSVIFTTYVQHHNQATTIHVVVERQTFPHQSLSKSRRMKQPTVLIYGKTYSYLSPLIGPNFSPICAPTDAQVVFQLHHNLRRRIFIASFATENKFSRAGDVDHRFCLRRRFS